MPTPLKTGTTVGIKFTYRDGTSSLHGSWRVPHDTEYRKMSDLGESLGHALIFGGFPSKTVIKAEIIDWNTRKEIENDD